MGDPSGIGPEIIAKALSKPQIRNLASFKIIGDLGIYKRYSKKEYKNCSFIDLKAIQPKCFKIGKINEHSGKAAFAYLEKSVELLKSGEINSIVTAPVCKEAISLSHPSFCGHTEFFAAAFNVKKYGMMFLGPNLRLLLATRHMPINKIPAVLTSELIYETIDLADKTLKNTFRIKKPSIAILGLNPHAGEGGLLGKEEIEIIIPAMNKAIKHKIAVSGPFSADTFFIDRQVKYDMIIAIYHDQGLIPIKTLYFTQLVNFTIGLPIIRTSPAHGTAFDIAGKGTADPASMIESIKLATHLSQ
ncbi:MAG: 4-hydroxythreonine-4-phosphate dehydrogenase PdxA [Candidatus Omnitrophica bacterium]|nr:4-hydroxythreonine-4-phosphate dehydrogenase PdxA [Candidatus Omnitrophota bacterium]